MEREPFGLTDTEVHFGQYKFRFVEHPGREIKLKAGTCRTHEGNLGWRCRPMTNHRQK